MPRVSAKKKTYQYMLLDLLAVLYMLLKEEWKIGVILQVGKTMLLKKKTNKG